MKSNNQRNDFYSCRVLAAHIKDDRRRPAERASLPCSTCSYAATLLMRRIVSESHFCSHACWLLSLTLVRCNRYCKPKVRPKNRAVGGVALAGLGIVLILSSVSMVTCAFSHCQHGSRNQKIVPLHQWPCFYPFKNSLILLSVFILSFAIRTLVFSRV